LREKDFIAVGRVGKPHGLRGGFFLRGSHHTSEFPYREVLIGTSPQNSKKHPIRQVYRSGDQLVVVTDIDRNTIEAIADQFVYVPRSEAGTDVLWADLIGLKVLDRGGELVGEITDVYNAGATDILVIKAKGTLELPYTETYFGEIKNGVLQALFAKHDMEDQWQ
jgi:16S rRNA processing protein RimM